LLISVLFEDLQLSKPIVAGITLVLAGNLFILRGRDRAEKIICRQPDNDQALCLAAERLR